jgi:hypothetical protein
VKGGEVSRFPLAVKAKYRTPHCFGSGVGEMLKSHGVPATAIFWGIGILLVSSAFGQEGSDPSAKLAKQLAKLVNGTLPNYVKFGYGAAPNPNYVTMKGGISARPLVRSPS